MKKVCIKKLSLLLFLFTSTANADLKREGEKLCKKIRSCAVVAMDRQQMSTDERTSILNILDTRCVASIQQYENSVNFAGLEIKAKACITSLTNLSCDFLMVGSGPLTTPLCTDFENAAKAAGIQLGR